MAGIKINGPNNRWKCDGCGREDWWGPGWRVYGSGLHEDTCPFDMPAACCDECSKVVLERIVEKQYVLPKLSNKGYYSVVVEPRKGY